MASRRSFGSIKKQRSGRYQASYELSDGTRVTGPQTYRTKMLANDWLAEQQVKINSGTIDRATRPMTFGEYSETFIAVLESNGASPRTIVDYKSLLKNRILPHFEKSLLRDISADAVKRWYVAQGSDKPSARAHAYGLLMSIMKSATRERLIDHNPVDIKGASNVKPKSEVQVLTPAEIDKLASLMPERYRLMVYIASWTSLRFGELTELRRSDVDVETGTIVISRAVVHTTEHGAVVKSPKSAAGVRVLIMPAHLHELVRAHMRSTISGGKDGLLFPAAGDPHKHMVSGTLAKVFYRARSKMGRSDLKWHHLRHTGATTYAQSGATIKETMDYLGHSTHKAAMVYQHSANDERKRELAARMSELAMGGNA